MNAAETSTQIASVFDPKLLIHVVADLGDLRNSYVGHGHERHVPYALMLLVHLHHPFGRALFDHK